MQRCLLNSWYADSSLSLWNTKLITISSTISSSAVSDAQHIMRIQLEMCRQHLGFVYWLCATNNPVITIRSSTVIKAQHIMCIHLEMGKWLFGFVYWVRAIKTISASNFRSTTHTAHWVRDMWMTPWVRVLSLCNKNNQLMILRSTTHRGKRDQNIRDDESRRYKNHFFWCVLVVGAVLLDKVCSTGLR